MAVAQLGSSTKYLRLSPDDPSAGPPQTLVAELRVATLAATLTVGSHYETGFSDLADYFAAMETDWRGWEGVRRWTSPEDELTFEAHHDGHIRLAIVLRDVYPWTWTASARLTLEPGEQLSAAAADLHALAYGS